MYDVFIFQWDNKKAHANILKHGVDFEEAMSAFYDDYSWCTHDPDHSIAEDRFLLLGASNQGRLLVISHVYRENDENIRIVSARLATKNERKEYLKYWG